MTTHDPYRSRQGAQWELVERQDPVRWGDHPGPLTDDEVARFERDGFLLMPRLLGDDEVTRLLEACHRLADELGATAREDVVREPGTDVIRSIFRVHEADGVMARLASDERLAGAARQILGDDVYVHQSRINFKPGFDGQEFYWHSDFETWHVEDGMPRMRALSASVLLTENTTTNGPLMLVPGSHRAFVRCVGETPEDHYKTSLEAQEFGVPSHDALRHLVKVGGITQATGPPGTVLLFDCNTMHGSTGNLSPHPRHNAFVCFNSVRNRLVEPFGGTAPRPGFLADRSTDVLAR